jgi:putative FmdB family regulatory protein
MPSYSFKCQDCGEVFVKLLAISADHKNISCPNGHGRVQRIYSAPGINFKGSGFYVNDSKNKTGAHSSS